MADELKIVIKAEDKASGNIKTINSAIKGLGSTSQNAVKNGLTPLRSALGTGLKVGAGVGAAGIATLAAAMMKGSKQAMTLEQSVADIASVMNKTADEVAPLKALIKDLGLDPALKVDSFEAAQAIQMLARNGISMTDILNGAARSTVLLANATGADFSTSADVATDAMKLFNIDADKMNTAVNGVSSVLTASKFDINDYKLALANAGGAAKVLGVGFSDFNTVIAASASFFASGSDAGTSYKTFLTRLQPTTKVATEKMKELGLMTEDGANKFFKASGEIESMATITDLLNKATRDMTPEMRKAALETIFGSDAMRTAAAMSEITKEEFNTLQTEMGKTDATKMASTRMNTLAGSLEIAHGIIQGVTLQIGDALNPAVRKMTDAFSKFMDDHKVEIVAFFTTLSNKIIFLTDNFGLVKSAVVALKNIFTDFKGTTSQSTEAISSLLLKLGVTKEKTDTLTSAIRTAADIFRSLLGVVAAILQPITSAVTAFGGWQSALVALGAAVSFTVIPAIAAFAASITPLIATIAAVGAAVSVLHTGWVNDVGGIKTAMTNVFGVVLDLFKQTRSGAIDWQTAISNAFTSVIGWVQGQLPVWKAKLSEWATAAFTWIADAAPGAIDKLGGWMTKMVDWLLGPGLVKLNSGIGSMFQKMGEDGSASNKLMLALGSMLAKVAVAIVENAAQIGWAIVSGLIEAFIPGAAKMNEAISTFVSKLWTSFKTFLGIASPSTIAKEIGLNLVQGLINGFNIKADSFLPHIKAVAIRFVDNMKSILSPTALAATAKDWIGGMASSAVSAMTAFAGNVKYAADGVKAAIEGKMTSSTLAATGQNFISGLSTKVDSTMNSLKTHVGVKATEIKDKISSGLGNSALLSSGKNLVQGLISGFDSTINQFRDIHLPSIATTVKDKFKSLFGIRSPSTVFAEYGTNLMEGLTAGMKDSMGSVLATVDNVGGAINNTADNSITSTTNNVRNFNVALPGQRPVRSDGSGIVDEQITSLVTTLSTIT